MLNRARADSQSDTIKSFFEKLFAIASEPGDDVTLNILRKLECQVLSAAAEEAKFIRKPAGEFTLEEAVRDFNLTYSFKRSETLEKHWWKIGELPEVKTFQPSACLGKVSP
jgi:hypothetical protein